MTKITAAGAIVSALGSSLLNSALKKSSKATDKKPYNSTISFNGNDIASSKVGSRSISTNYNMSDTEKDLLNYTNNELLSGLQNINVFSDDVQKNIQDQVKAYRQKGIESINETYQPMLNNLKADIASRFGNLDNSSFMDNLNSIERNRAKSISDLTQDILAKQNELYEQELNNRYNYLEALSSTNENLYSNILNFLQLASDNTDR